MHRCLISKLLLCTLTIQVYISVVMMFRNCLDLGGSCYKYKQYSKYQSKLYSFHTKRVDPKDNLFSNKKTFEDIGISPTLLQALRRLNYTYATPIQEMSYTAVLSDKDVIIGSETGSGKTLSYLIPLFDKILTTSTTSVPQSQIFYPSTVILAPNKELCRQVESMAKEVIYVLDDIMGVENPIRIEAITELSDYWSYSRGNSPNLLICTPKFLSNFVQGPKIYEPELFQNIRQLVLDEADMLLEGSYRCDIDQIFDSIRLTRRALVRDGQIEVHEKWTQFILSAATIPSFGLKSVQAYVQKRFPDALVLRSDHLHTHHPLITQKFVKSCHDDTLSIQHIHEILAVISEGTERSPSLLDTNANPTDDVTHTQYIEANNIDHLVMIFLNTASNAEKFAIEITNLGVKCVQFHNLLRSAEKEENLKLFRDGTIRIMVCTDSAARGLDLPAVRHVIQAEFALNVVQHLHRIGRASRGGILGRSTNFYNTLSADLVESIVGTNKNESINLDSIENKSIEKSFSRKRGFRRNMKRSNNISQ